MNGDWRDKLRKIEEKMNNSEKNKIINLGYAFQTQDYYKQTEKTSVEDDVKRIVDFTLDDKTKEMIKSRQKELKKLIKGKNSKLDIGFFEAYVNYPGLIVGMSNPVMSSLKQELDEKKNNNREGQDSAFKTGFSFDYVTGLPYIPGSSIKGMLRASMNKYWDDVQEWIHEHSLKEEIKKIEYDDLINQLFGDDDIEKNAQNDNICNTNVSKRDVFLDAIIVEGDKKGEILKSDYITPHKSMFENPIPIRILALKPKVKLQFHFLLAPRKIAGISKEKRFELYKGLIMELGIGAKTNTGYGSLI